MKHNFMTKMVSALLAVVLSTAAFSVTAFASGGEESTESVAEQETAGDVSDLLSALAGSQVTVSVTEDGIQFSSGGNGSGQTGTVTTGGGNLNVRTGAGMDYTAFTQLPNGTTVKVIGTDGDWLKVILPEKVGYVYSGYMTVSDGERVFLICAPAPTMKPCINPHSAARKRIGWWGSTLHAFSPFSITAP